MTEAAPPEEIFLSLPAQSAYARIARVGAAALALRLEFSLTSIDDLRLALDEALILLLGHHERDGRLDIVYTVSDASLQVHASAVFVDDDDARLDDASVERFVKIAAGLVDSWEIDAEAPSFTIALLR